MPEFLFVGLATDGPSYRAVRPKDLRELRTLFGGNFIERLYVTPAATSLTLQFDPWSLPVNEVDSLKSYLYAPYLNTASRKIMSFGNIGGSGTHTVDLLYTPYLGKSDLIIAATRYYNSTGKMPYVVRVGGDIASLSVEGWEFESKYQGSKYNYLGLSSNGSALTVFGMEPNYPTLRYTYTTPVELFKAIERDFQLGISPIVCTKPGTAMLSVGIHWFGSGSDGSFSDTEFNKLMSNYSLPIQPSHIVLLKELTSGMVNTISTELSDKTIQPKMFFTASPTYAVTGNANEWIDQIYVTLPFRHNMIASFIGNITLNFQGEQIDRYAVEGATIAFSKADGFNLTNLPVEADSFTPVLSGTNLEIVKANGFIPLMRYIGNDIAVYEGTTTYNENTFLYSSKVAEICSIAQEYCYQYLGLIFADGEKTVMAKELWEKLLVINYIELQKVRIYKEGEEMFVFIDALLFDEILSISFTVKNK